MSRIPYRLRVTRCTRLSVQTIWGRSFGIQEMDPIFTATGVSRPMTER